MQPSLMTHDDDKEAFWALGVSKKGVTEPIAKWCVGVIHQSGYAGQHISFKTDQEPSILALKRAVAAAHVGETVPIESPVRSSKSNGRMEAALRVWQGQLRTQHIMLSARWGGELQSTAHCDFVFELFTSPKS